MNVVDTTAPVITVTGANPATIEQGATYSDAGATATDAVDGDLTESIVVTGSVDTSIVGTYTLTYNVSDTAGNAATEVTRTVVVEAIPIPITLVIPDDLVINAMGFLTGVNLDPESVASAINGDGKVINVVADQTGPFQSGSYDIVWSATSAGNTVSATQSLKIVPLVNLATAITTTEGNSLEIKVLLSGQAADYPVIISFSVGGTAIESDDYNIDPSGSVTITEGTVGTISLSSTEDTVAESEETIVITLANSTNAALGILAEQVITIVEENLPPMTTLVVSQGSLVSSTIAQDAGTAMIKAEISDANLGDMPTVDWTNTLLTLPQATVVVVDGEGPGFSYEVLEFDPADLAVGVYSLDADVTDGVNAVTVTMTMRVVAAAVVLSELTDSDGDGLSDAQESAGDSDGDGIPNYLDNVDSTNTQVSTRGAMHTEPGTTLMLGSLALVKGNHDVIVTEDEIAARTEIADTSYEYPADLVDFAVTGAEFGHGYMLVIQLPMGLPEDAVYRKYSTDGGWAHFVENATNTLSSTMAVEGTCPELGSDTYALGLTAGDNCLGLLIEEGGPNDADGVINGTLVDPSGIAVKTIGTPSDNSEVALSDTQLTANGTDKSTVTVTAYNADGVGLEHMSVSASVAISGAVISAFVDEGNGVYTATLTVGNVSGSAAVVAVINNGEMSVSTSSEAVTVSAELAPPAPAASSGGGGCTVGTNGSADASLLLLLTMAGLLLVRRRYQLR